MATLQRPGQEPVSQIHARDPRRTELILSPGSHLLGEIIAAFLYVGCPLLRPGIQVLGPKARRHVSVLMDSTAIALSPMARHNHVRGPKTLAGEVPAIARDRGLISVPYNARTPFAVQLCDQSNEHREMQKAR